MHAANGRITAPWRPCRGQYSLAPSQAAAKAGIDKQLLELIKLRASQINGCVFCVQFHILQGESLGVAPDKLNLVAGARAPPFRAQRVALALHRRC